MTNSRMSAAQRGPVRETNSEKGLTTASTIDSAVIDSGDDEAARAFAIEQLTDPDKEAFVAMHAKMRRHPEAESRDLLHFKDGRIFERTSLAIRRGVGGIACEPPRRGPRRPQGVPGHR